jgi:hypothetical protein
VFGSIRWHRGQEHIIFESRRNFAFGEKRSRDEVAGGSYHVLRSENRRQGSFRLHQNDWLHSNAK